MSKAKPTTFVELIDMFGIEELAQILGVEYVIVQKMRFRNSIKVTYWPQIAYASRTQPLYGREIKLEEIHSLRSGKEHHPGTNAKTARRAA